MARTIRGFAFATTDRTDYDGNPLPFDPTCALCEFGEYPHEH